MSEVIPTESATRAPESVTRTHIEEEVDIDSAESWKYTPKRGLGPKTAVMMETKEFLQRAEKGTLKMKPKRKKKPKQVLPKAQRYQRSWIQVLHDTGDILVRDGETHQQPDEILPDEYPVLMHKTDYLSVPELEGVWKVQDVKRTGKSKSQQYYESLPRFMQKGQCRNFSTRKEKKLDKVINNWTQSNESKFKLKQEVKLGQMRHEMDWKESDQFKQRMEDASRIQMKEVKPKNGLTFTKEDYPELRQHWIHDYQDVFQEQPETLPPKRDVTHRIPVKDPDKQYSYYIPRCPDYLKPELLEKINKYVRAGWWVPCQVDQAAPMLCIPKKNKTLRTAIDCRKRNDNTLSDVTPFPDQENIRNDVAKAKARSKIDMTNAYEQILVHDDDVKHTAFATIFGTFFSRVMQIGDCNAPATFQRLMTSVFRDCIGKFVHVYLDDIFVFSDSVEDHEKHLKIVFELLRKNLFYLREDKVQLYAEVVECLGHKIDDKGIHADGDKMARIRDWKQPRTYNDVQRFLGLVQYISPYLPDISAFTSPLAAMNSNHQPFHWRPLHTKCFDQIKHICAKTPVLQPIDPKKKEPIWIICDASVSGVGAMYGQGLTWQSCRPAGFMSKKFTNAQRHYRVFEQESLAILEALLKWEEKLIGYEIHVVTDHRALEFFQRQKKLSPRQTRWMEYLARFDFDITYVKGTLNKVADALSRYYESDTWYDARHIDEYVNADVRIDRDMEDLPPERVDELVTGQVEMHATRVVQTLERRQSERLLNKQEQRDLDAAKIASGMKQVGEEELPTVDNDADPTVEQSRSRGKNLRREVFQDNEKMVPVIKEGYLKDALFKKVLTKPNQYQSFEVKDGLIWTQTRSGDMTLCVPNGTLDGKSVRGIILETGHELVGHYGPQKTIDYIRRWYWWPRMSDSALKFCNTCSICQRTKGDYTKAAGLLHSLPIPTQPWESIGMDFIGPFPESRGFNYIWVVVCRLTSMVHLIPVRTDTTASQLSWIYLREIVRLHGLPDSIVSDRDSKFTSKWWKELHRILGAKLLMSTSFHPQTDGLTERINRSVAQIIRSMISADQTDWYDMLALAEFAINSAISSTTGYAPFELNYVRMPQLMSSIKLEKAENKGVKEFVELAVQRLNDAYDSIIQHRVFQKFQADKHGRPDPILKQGDKVYLSTKDLSLPKGRASKFLPKFIGPYLILDAKSESSTYRLDLPNELKGRNIHDVFHISKLRPYLPSDDSLFPGRKEAAAYDFGEPDEETGVKEIDDHRWKGKKLEFHVLWDDGDNTWETYSNIQECIALDAYLELKGVINVTELPKSAPQRKSRSARS